MWVINISKSKYDVNIGRPGPWGNPFIIGRDGTREEVVNKHRAWFLGQPLLIKKAKKELKGKMLGCWCAPLACHGDVLSEIAND